MKSLVFSMALTLTGQAFAGLSPYKLQSVPHENIEEHILIGSDETGTPKNLQGLWWMDGNPLADEVVSFASAQIEPIYEDEELTGYKANIPVYDEGIWSWHDSFGGRLLYRAVENSRLVYEGIFDIDFTHGEVTPIIKLFSVFPELQIPQSMIVNFSMTQVSEDEWSRDSVLFGDEHQYRFRRIVDGQGNRLPAYEDYLISIETRELGNAVLPICKKDLESDILPTACSGF